VPLVLGVDSSTQSTKVEVRDADTGALVASGRAPHPATTPPRSEQHPQDWWRALEAACAQVDDAVLRDVRAVSVAGQQHGLVVLDASGAVLRPAKLWNDTESAPDAEWLIDQLVGPARWADACGSVPVASFTITKLSWLHRSEPELWPRVAAVMLPHDWLTLQLSGETATDRGDASGTGYWSPSAGAYRFDLLAIVDRDRDWEPMLPRVAGPDETVGSARSLLAGVLVGAGTGDNMAAALGLGLQTGDVSVSIGTSGTVFARSAVATHDASGAVAGFADATGRHLPLVATLNAARVLDAAAPLLGVDANRVQTLSFGLGVSMAAAAGAVYGVIYPFNPGSHYDLISRLLSIVVLGGLGSLGGAVIASLVMGVTEAVVAVEWKPTWAAFSYFVVLIAFLLVRPQGIFGTAERVG